MEAEKNPTVSQTNSLVIGTGALIIGYAIGSGRWNWLSHNALKVAQGLGTMALLYLSQSFQKHNPELFTSAKRITH